MVLPESNMTFIETVHNKLVLDQLGRRAGVNESILDIITEKDNTRKFLMIRKLVMGLKELQDEYPIEKKKE